MQMHTLTSLIIERNSLHDRGVTFIGANNQEEFFSCHALFDNAVAALGFLQHKGLRAGDELVFQLQDNKTFLITFWACVLGGIIPVPISVGRNADQRQKLLNVWNVLSNPWMIISDNDLDDLQSHADRVVADNIVARRIDPAGIYNTSFTGNIRTATEDEIAFIQFSSGSTGRPKGVVLTHKNLIANLDAISKASKYSASDSLISWMPLTHDMGLIGFHLSPLFNGLNHYIIPTDLFVRRPELWIDKTSEHKVTILCSPNFGYKYFLRHSNAAQRYHWDLTSVRIIYNGAEPISEKLCRQFLQRLQQYGLAENSMRPVYGLAEASVAVTISHPGAPVIALKVDRSALHIGDTIVPRDHDDEKSIVVLNVGEPIDHCSVRIADENDEAVENEVVGHIQIKGTNVTGHYYRNEADTLAVFTKDGWLKTGDTGFVRDRSLYIIGRAKDIFFINGQNYYPFDVERVLEEIDGIELNKVAVAGAYNEQMQQEEVFVFILYKGEINEFLPIVASVKALVNNRFGFEADHVIPIKDMPKTTSGKLQRFKLLEQYRNGQYDVVLQLLQELMKTRYAKQQEPVNEMEEKILALWKDVLGNDNISVEQDFFEAGGNSLKAAEVEMKLWELLQTELPNAILYRAPTIRQLADSIKNIDRKQFTPIPVASKSDYYPCSSVQRRLYYLWEADKDSIGYNIPFAFDLNGSVDIQVLQESIRHLITRHDILRAAFQLKTEPVFTIQEEVPFLLDCIECGVHEVNTMLRAFVKPFDLANGPLFRFRILKTGENNYILFMDFHHIVADGVSIFNFLRELLMNYNNAALPAPTIQYTDYAAWEPFKLLSERKDVLKAYWENELGQNIPALELPTDLPRPALFNPEGERIKFEIDTARSNKLRELATKHNCTLHALLFTIYRTLLLKYTGQDDIIIGIPVAGRNYPGLQDMQGVFVNNLCIRTQTADDDTFVDLLHKCNTRISAAMQHEDYLFEEILQFLNVKRNVSRNPVFDTMFLYQNMGLPRTGRRDLSLSRHYFNAGFSRYDITMEVFDDEAIVYVLEYATSLFKRDTIIRFAKHFDSLIDRIIESPSEKLSCISVLPVPEYDQLVRSIQGPAMRYPSGTIHELFEMQVVKTPEAIAVECGHEVLTYAQLNERANELADVIGKHDVVPGSTVAILLPNSIDLLIGILAVLKSGAAYVPIDVSLPAARVDYILQDSQCRLKITSSGVSGTGNIQRTATATDLAYVIYTSGTTGNPKGVMISHSSLVNYITWAAAQYVREEKATFPLFTSISFDLTVTSIFTPLITGNKIIIYDAEERSTVIEDILRENRVNVVKLTPSHLKIMRDSLRRLHEAPAIKRFIVGGENLTVALAKEISAEFGDQIEIINEYGPTEATVGCMIHVFNPGDEGLNVPIGLPAANTRLWILDKFLKPVSTGVPGELYISGDGLARGYLHRDELTAQKFIPNPFDVGGRMYRTGDIVRMLANGNIDFIGRSDQQVKINGYRVELAEIEHCVAGIAGVTEVVAVVKTGRQHRPCICAYYTSKDNIEEKILKKASAERMPYYMVPERFVRLSNIPLTNNGKIDVDALPDPSLHEKDIDIVETGNSIHSLYRHAWEEVLGRRNISINDNFYELGGDSIKAVQIASKLYDKGILVKPRDILTFHTIEQSSGYATAANVADRSAQGPVTGEMGLSFIESWFFGQQFPNQHFYNQSVLLRFNKTVDKDKLEDAFRKLIYHHDQLRINYDPVRQKLFYNEKHLDAAFNVKSLTVKSDDNGLAQATLTKFKSGFDITSSILIDAALINGLLPQQCLLITAHHLVTDGVSWRILLQDLYTIYTSLEHNKDIKLSRKTASLLEWKQKLAENVNLSNEEDENIYRNQEEDIDLSLPQDFETDDWSFKHSGKISGTLDEAQTNILTCEAPGAYRADVPALLNTALALTLAEWTGRNTFIVEQESHGRNLQDLDVSRTLGWFTLIYPVKLKLHKASLGQQISFIKEQLRSGQQYARLHNIMSNQQESTIAKQVEVRFNYLGSFNHELENDLFSYCSEPHGSDVSPDNHMTAKLELNSMIVQDKLFLEIQFNKKAHSPATIDWFRDTFFNNLQEIFRQIGNDRELQFTPSDFEAANLNQQDLDELFGLTGT